MREPIEPLTVPLPDEPPTLNITKDFLGWATTDHTRQPVPITRRPEVEKQMDEDMEHEAWKTCEVCDEDFEPDGEKRCPDCTEEWGDTWPDQV